MSDKVSPNATSAFNRLQVPLKAKESPVRNSKSETPAPKTDEPAIRVATSGLNESANNNIKAANSLNSLSAGDSSTAAQDEVAKANEASSRSSVRDVEEAAALADKLAFRISARENEALGAIKNPNPDVVKNLLN